MDEKEIKNLLQSGVDQRQKGWRCPDDNQLAAYINKQISTDQKRKLEKHFADCNACLDTLTFLSNEAGEPEIVPPQLLARARALAQPATSPLWRWRWAMATATACLLVVVVFIVWKTRTPQTPNDLIAQVNQPSVSTLSPTPTVELRPAETVTSAPKPKVANNNVRPVRGENNVVKPSVISPREGETVKASEQAVRWKPVPDTDFYELRIVTEDGRAVLSERTNQTQYVVPGPTLQPGAKYFVHVDAHIAGGRSVRSDLVTFRVSP